MDSPLVVTFSATARLEGNTLLGVAHLFGERADLGTHYEEIAVGGFDEAMRSSDPRAFVEHDRSKLLGRVSSKTLTVAIEQVAGRPALTYAIDLPDTTYARDLKALVERGDLRESSFGFIPGESAWSKAANGLRVRTHTRVKELIDVSPVAMPAFSGTSAQLHSRSFAAESLGSQLVRARARVAFGEDR
jgi:uncharacterized protein